MSTRSPNQSVKLTKTAVDKTPIPAAGQTFLRDTELSGFGLRITSAGVKSFILEKRINGRVRRMTLGRFGELAVEEARRLARIKLGQIAQGVDPVAEAHKARRRGTTLEHCYQGFLKARKHLTPKTRYGYQRLMETALADWRHKPITSITKAMVLQKHRELGAKGEYGANAAMRLLRALLNFAQATYDDGDGHSMLPENPVRVLTQTRAWYREERRRTVIKIHALPAWYRGIQALKAADQTDTCHGIADWLLLLLFTGLRRVEAFSLRWQDVDLEARTLTIPEPKNREPLTLPLGDFVFELLTRRRTMAVNEYVFPGKDGRGYLIEPKRQIANVVEASGVVFSAHDLRRTFITVAEGLDIPPYAIKRLVNHKMNNDVTAGYIITDVERLRGPVKKLNDFLVSALQVDGRDNVVVFPGTDLPNALES